MYHHDYQSRNRKRLFACCLQIAVEMQTEPVTMKKRPSHQFATSLDRDWGRCCAKTFQVHFILELKATRSFMGWIHFMAIKMRLSLKKRVQGQQSENMASFVSFMKHWLTNGTVLHYTVLYLSYMLSVLYSAGYHELLSWLLHVCCKLEARGNKKWV